MVIPQFHAGEADGKDDKNWVIITKTRSLWEKVGLLLRSFTV
jgi:hypothetical protein